MTTFITHVLAFLAGVVATTATPWMLDVFEWVRKWVTILRPITIGKDFIVFRRHPRFTTKCRHCGWRISGVTDRDGYPEPRDGVAISEHKREHRKEDA